MYDEIQQIIVPNTLTSFEYTKIEELLDTYTEDEIIDAYRKVGYKPINYIKKVIKKKTATNWINKEITNEAIDEETEKTFNDFQEFLKKFREN